MRPWVTADPFLFCMHHVDAYPRGDERMRPAAPLDGRDLGQDFSAKDGWSMYHGTGVPGFPQHPHRGFETVTIVRRGLVDHSDSLGATARFGRGDVQWLTAGSGIVHAEMFPLVERERDNPLELFQIWLNLPHASKLVAPHFAMLWADQLPVVRDGAAEITVIAGELDGRRAPSPPAHSWAAKPEHQVSIWLVRVEPGKRWTPPAARPGVNRTIHPFGENEFLLLEGRPIDERVEQYGPFVMNSREEILQAFADYRRTGFGGWPWKSDDPVHPREAGRFARHADGRTEKPSSRE